MKLTTKQLKQMIKEELQHLYETDQYPYSLGDDEDSPYLRERGRLLRKIALLKSKLSRIRQDADNHSGGGRTANSWYYADKFFYDYGGMEVEEELAKVKAELEELEARNDKLPEEGEDL